MRTIKVQGSKPTILIADDDLSTRMLLRATISQWDYPVIEASDGEEAWEILKQNDGPQIATVDWMMPKLDGLDLCRRTINLPRPPYMILLTSMSGASNVVNALDSGADDFLTKPFNFIELRSRLHVGQRIINYANRLESVINEKKPHENISQHLPITIKRLNAMGKKILDEWINLQSMLHLLEAMEKDNHIKFKNQILGIYERQKELIEEITSLETFLGHRASESKTTEVKARKTKKIAKK
ncbi:TPA: response regulator [Legionella pneumophila]|uniref:response regulator n=1 Tax=Legionella pneumophila TaxID=446 RepID=UPI00067F1F7C|nr:response regulator transcription factor [Legionella pneumophila]HAT1827761.1 response regulator [Legionella pneumophila]